ncbi:MAG: hypothetical protein SW127_10845 [Actinomycetota bacterium]|nr:hypothetical protein [Actinomycetota bacterium]
MSHRKNRMNREEFYSATGKLDDNQLRRVLWTVYWRGNADLRERIEGEIAEPGGRRSARAPKPVPDGAELAREVADFVALARAGAYMAGSRRVSPRERTRWRFTFKRLASDSQQALAGENPDQAATALTALIDLACVTAEVDLFRSDDPMEAAGFVVSDAVAHLWASTRDRCGFDAFAGQAAPQLIRWESRFGWTRRGMGSVAAKETTLASVLHQMLRGGEMWARFAQHYVQALDDRPGSRRAGHLADDLAQWHLYLLNNLDDTPNGVLDQIAQHSSLVGVEQKFFAAQLALRRADVATARQLVTECLRTLPGHPQFRAFAAEVGADTM